MEDKIRQPQLLDAYINDLLQNPRISPPLDLNLELAEITREMVLVQQHTAATNTARATQGRVWKEVLDAATFSIKNVQTAGFGWRYVRASGLQVAAGLVLALVVILILSGPNSHPSLPMPVHTNVAAELITQTPMATAPLITPILLPATNIPVMSTKTSLPLRNVRSNHLNDGTKYSVEAKVAPDIDEVSAPQGFNSHRVYYR